MNKFFTVFILITINLLIYSNTFHATWHFDDFHNIVRNADTHLETLSPQALYQSLFLTNNQGEKKFQRPLARLSLALNWYFGQREVFGYHVVNLAIHCLTAIFLYYFLLGLQSIPRVGSKNKKQIQFIALLSAVLWSINPVQTQAVTFIVQRMASMCGMFYILAMLCYLRFRIDKPDIKKRMLWLSGAVFSFILGFFSKENALLLPFSIFLIEWFFLQDMEDPKTRKKVFIASAILTVCIFTASVFLVLKGNPLHFLNGYAKRPFTFSQRLLTEPRIVLFYISLLFYPIPTRLNLDHDVVVSTSLLSPVTTLPSILGIVFLIILGFYLRRKQPLIGFAIIFFFLNHAVESSIYPLELIFEHRNYIPSMFLFIPVAMVFYKGIEYYQNNHNTKMRIILTGTCILLMIGIGISTYNRNNVWYSEKSLWEDCISKNPNSIRSYHNLAFGHYDRIGDHDSAIELYKKAIDLKNSANKTAQADTYHNIALQYLAKKDYHEAEFYWLKAIDIFPRGKIIYGLARLYIELNDLNKALFYIDKAIEARRVNKSFDGESAISDYYLVKGHALLHTKDPGASIPYFAEIIEQDAQPIVFAKIGSAHVLSGSPQKGLWFLKRARQTGGIGPSINIYLADAYFSAGDIEKAGEHIKIYIESTPLNAINSFIEKLNHDLSTIPVHDDVKTMLKEQLQAPCSNFTEAS